MDTVVDPPARSPEADVLVAGYHVSSFGYRPELDGIRALAVVSVLLYHGTVWWASGGFLGVDLFFVLSGYLITTLLLIEQARSGTVALRAFWGRRLRRLLPALLVVLAWVGVYAAVFADPAQVDTLRGDAIASLFYVANWRFVFSGASYFEQFLAPSPLRHMWSLAIEEQWYIFWPIIVMVGLRYSRNAKVWVLGISAATALSAGIMFVLFDPDADPSRVYYGTDARAQALLIGAGLAFLLRSTQGAGGRPLPEHAQRAVKAAGVLSFSVVLLMLFVLATDDASWMYRGGFTVFALAAAGLIAGIVQPGANPLRSALAFGPLPAIGRISYGLYLYHWPVYVLLTAERTGIDGDALLWLRLTATTVIAVVSYHVVEMPIRRGNLGITKPLVPVLACTGAVALLVLLGTAQRSPAGSTDGNSDAVAVAGQGRVLLVGDSVAWGLAADLDRAANPAIAVRNGAMIGCGITGGTYLPASGPGMSDTFKCEERVANWKEDVADFNPQVSVILPGAYEVFDHEVDGQVLAFDSEEYRAFLRDEIETGIATLTTGGGRVALLTSPCFQPDKVQVGSESSNERADTARVDTINDIIRDVAKADPAVTVLDLHGFVCPTGSFQAELEGVDMYRDGVHYSAEGSAKVWAWLLPQLAEIKGVGNSPPPSGSAKAGKGTGKSRVPSAATPTPDVAPPEESTP